MRRNKCVTRIEKSEMTYPLIEQNKHKGNEYWFNDISPISVVKDNSTSV